MAGDEIAIDPEQVHVSGALIDGEAGEARTALSPMFDSAQPAADGNKGFAAGPELVTYAALLKTEMEDTIAQLASAGQQIVNAAQSMRTMDTDNTTGFNRIVTALNGLGKPPE